MYWLGLDVGTGGSRALLVDAGGAVRYSFHGGAPRDADGAPALGGAGSGRLVARGARGNPRSSRRAGASGDSVRGIGLSGQMHGLVLLDEDNKVIRPALIWCDQRSQPQVDLINAKVGGERAGLHRESGADRFYAAEIAVGRDNEPPKFERVRKMLLPKDYLAFQADREFATDVSDASGTALSTWCTGVVGGDGRGAGTGSSILRRLTNRARSRAK